MSNLNPKQFQDEYADERAQPWYHSSNANLTPGVDQILPANDPRVGGSQYGYSHHDNEGGGGWGPERDGSSRGDWTFAADTEREAEAWKPHGGRPVTYVVKPRDDTDIDFESHHYLTEVPEDQDEDGFHLKARGPMDIVDRIDIPRPRHADEVVQGTLPPQNWGQFNKLPEGYEGPATMGEQHPATDNFKRTDPVHERERQGQVEWEQHRTRNTDQILYEDAWKRAGQQELGL